MGTIKFKNSTENTENAISEQLSVTEEIKETTYENISVSEKMAEAILAEKESKEEPTILFEDLSKREENVKHFKMSNGTYQAQIFNEPIHYYDNNEGKFISIDNTFCECAKCQSDEDDFEGYQNKKGKVRVKFNKNTNDNNLFFVEKGEHKLSWKLLGKKNNLYDKEELNITEAKIKNNSLKVKDVCLNKNNNSTSEILYNNFTNGADLQYILENSRIKENIIIKEKSENYEYSFYLKVNNLDIRLSKDNNSIDFYSKSINSVNEQIKEEMIFTIPTPYMYDANGSKSEEIIYNIEKKFENEYLFTIKASTEWINNEKRVFPVTIDPEIKFIYTLPGAVDNFFEIEQKKTGSFINNNAYINCPYFVAKLTSDNSEGYLSIKFNKSLFVNKKVYNAKLILNPYNTCYYNGDIAIISNNIIYKTIDTLNYGTPIIIDVTKIIHEQNDIQLKAINVTGDFYQADFSYYPYLQVNYFDVDYIYSTAQQQNSIKRAGDSSVDLFTGNLLLVHNDLERSGNRMPLNISHIYNSIHADKEVNNNMLIGKGWRLNLQQILEKKEESDSDGDTIYYWIYIDSKGLKHRISKQYYYTTTASLNENNTKNVKHYVEYKSGKSKNCSFEYTDGGNLFINNSDQNILTDKNGNKLSFNSDGWLIKIESALNSVNNSLNITYENNRITQVTDGIGRYATFTYNGNSLISISDQENNTVYFGNSTNTLIPIYNNLTSIRYGDTSSNSYYDYDCCNKLVRVKDDSGYFVKYTYNYDTNKIINIQEGTFTDKISYVNSIDYKNEIEYSNYVDIDYISFYTTAVKNQFNLRKCYIFDTVGNVKSAFEAYLNGSENKLSVKNNIAFQNTRLISGNIKIDENNPAFIPCVNENISVNTLAMAENILNNFESTNGAGLAMSGNNCWIGSGLQSTDTFDTDNYVNSKSFKINGTSGLKSLYYMVTQDNLENGSYILSGWAKADSKELPKENNRFNNSTRFELSVAYQFNSINNLYIEQRHAAFDANNKDWQYVAIPFYYSDTDNILNVKIKAEYSNNQDICYFSNIRLIKADASISTIYENDYIETKNEKNTIKTELTEKGNVYKNTINYGYENSYFYNDNNLLTTSIDYRGIKQEYEYDNIGNTKKHKISIDNLLMEENYFYDTGLLPGNKLTAYSDERDKTTTMTYDFPKKLLKTVTNPKGQTISYTYNDFTDTVKTMQTTVSDIAGATAKTNINKCIYNRGLLTETNHNYTQYHFEYDGYGRITQVRDKYLYPIVRYSYYQKLDGIDNIITAKNRIIIYYYGDTYLGMGTGETFAYYFDAYGNNICVKYIENGTVNSDFSLASLIIWKEYDLDQKLKKCVDYLNSKEYNYKYDNVGQLINYDEKNIEIPDEAYNIIKISTNYNDYNRLSDIYYTIKNATARHYVYAYDGSFDQRIKDITFPNNKISHIDYDALGRLKYRKFDSTGINLEDEYTYLANGSKTTSYIKSLKHKKGNISTDYLNYEYDDNGNITHIYNGSILLSHYEYDGINRLIREDIPETKSEFYCYDAGGNLIAKHKFNYYLNMTYAQIVAYYNSMITEDFSFYYSQSHIYYNYTESLGSKDKLTKYNDISLLRKYNDPNWEESVSCYDDQGNPYSWFKHSDTMPTTLGYDLKWKYCKQLTEVKTRETTPITYTYTYNDIGIRTKKTANGTTNQYYLEGSRIIAEDRTTSGVTTRLFYYYDANGLCGFNYNNADYYYVKNLQGDITEILDNTGTTVASYTYDAWGKILSATGTMATINPFRYRGYYYDSETKWYYLNSRYYDPIVGRFINSDDLNYLNPQSLNGLNLMLIA
jgi:RHS repeat-associated protein